MNETYRCGFVVLVGRPNVGKSTLMNRLLGEKLSITSHKPQTTRHRILGIQTTDDAQLIYVDTPGLHSQRKRAINRVMQQTALNSIHGIDIVVFLIDATKWTEEDELALATLKHAECPVILAINKVDLMSNKEELLPLIDKLNDKFDFAAVYPLSALHGDNTAELESFLISKLPFNPPFYDADQITDRGVKFMIAELIREKIFIYCQQELPYSTTVEIELMEEEKKIVNIAALIWVEREGQKRIVIGKKGMNLKRIGSEARRDIEDLLEKKVMLKLWVKVKEGWADDDRALQSLGYSQD